MKNLALRQSEISAIKVDQAMPTILAREMKDLWVTTLDPLELFGRLQLLAKLERSAIDIKS